MKKIWLLLMVGFWPCCFLFSQEIQLEKWTNNLNTTSSQQVKLAAVVEDSISRFDTSTIKKILQQLETAGARSSLRVQARVQALQARLFFYKWEAGDSLYAEMMRHALDKAYALNDIFVIAEFSRWYGEMLNSIGDQAGAALYCMNSIKLQEEAGLTNFSSVKTFYFTTAEMLSRTRNYRDAVNYYNQALSIRDSSIDKNQVANAINTLGRCYHFLKKYDSAIYAYKECMRYVKETGASEDWFYSASDNRYEPYLELKQYDSCRKIANDLWAEAQESNDSIMLMGASYMFARIAIRNHEFKEGLKWSLQSENYAGSRKNYLMAVYYDIAYCYEKLGENEKALPYYQLNKKLTDRRDSIANKANGAFLNAQSDFLKAQLRFKNLNEETSRKARSRNIILVIIAVLASSLIFLLYKRKKQTDLARIDAETRSYYFQNKFSSAEEQLKEFREIIENKSQKLQKLEEEQSKREDNNAHSETIHGLSSQIILTEKDWEEFKKSFNSIYPSFFRELRKLVPGITGAELRMAALLKLKFDTKHIASILGISQNSVHKTRYRLRKKLR